jgi:hypothetical protein
MKLTSVSVEPEQLLLDPNNYRFHDLENYRRPINRRKYADKPVQEKTLNLLQTTPKFELQSLKDSIATNGFVPLEQIVVEEYDNSGSKKRYLVVEGNRRVAAIKSLLDEIESGSITIPDQTANSFKKFQVIELIGSEAERANYKQILMAIRHVTGIREWGAYQQAKLIAELYEKGHQQFRKVAQSIGLKAGEVARRYRAIKALEQMENDDEYGESASPKLYAFFDEALAAQTVRDWLGWSDTTYQAENAENRRSFYELIIPHRGENGTYDAKLDDVRKVRKLKDIVNKPLAKSILLDPERNLDDAINAAQTEASEGIPGMLEYSIEQAIRVLNKPSINAWLNPTDQEKQLWNELVNLVDQLKSIIR